MAACSTTRMQAKNLSQQERSSGLQRHNVTTGTCSSSPAAAGCRAAKTSCTRLLPLYRCGQLLLRRPAGAWTLNPVTPAGPNQCAACCRGLMCYAVPLAPALGCAVGPAADRDRLHPTVHRGGNISLTQPSCKLWKTSLLLAGWRHRMRGMSIRQRAPYP